MLPAMFRNRLGSFELTKVRGVRFDIHVLFLRYTSINLLYHDVVYYNINFHNNYKCIKI